MLSIYSPHAWVQKTANMGIQYPLPTSRNALERRCDGQNVMKQLNKTRLTKNGSFEENILRLK